MKTAESLHDADRDVVLDKIAQVQALKKATFWDAVNAEKAGLLPTWERLKNLGKEEE